ncbi:MAG: septal ring lytic transglycosylase RlpA family protein [Abyssibacter sp.]|jgi:rare lipoprotein A|nr:septal ring lytic transglycosylase RlpA family protein [Abyssibacter sp.]MBB88282.1 septal ring lytic transglycosylase RlpA family lipoprotein [Xanthomonadales bacterium]MCK5860458.1 septal ring lytic transglycosylase RlpA family protein [Abyssibacter sp.]
MKHHSKAAVVRNAPAALAVLAALLLGGCFGGKTITPSDGPPTSPEVNPWNVPEAVPKYEPRSKYGNPESYVVAGKRYYVSDTAQGYRETGGASWYGSKFHGRRTSSGEPFDMYKMTAAHRTLPIPSYVRVRNLENNREIIVRVNDRGPFHSARIIDLSWVAAVRLGLDQQGSGQVEVEAITPNAGTQAVDLEPMEPARPLPATPTAAAPPPTPRPEPINPIQPGELSYLQVGAFGDLGNAERMAKRLRNEGFPQVHVRTANVRGQMVHRVLAGPFVNESDRSAARNVLASRGYETFVIRDTQTP